MRLRASESDHQAALVQTIRLFGRRAGVDVIHIVNELHPPKGLIYRSPGYYAWRAKLEAKGYKPGFCDLLIYWPFAPDLMRARDRIPPFGAFSALLIECKAPWGTLRTSQKIHHAELRARGIAHFVWDDGEPETAINWLRAHGCPL